jgi:hypothetical protein
MELPKMSCTILSNRTLPIYTPSIKVLTEIELKSFGASLYVHRGMAAWSFKGSRGGSQEDEFVLCVSVP